MAALDELYLFLDSPVTIEYIRNNMKRVRKKESAMVLASQNIEDFLIPNIREMTKPLFSIPTHQFLFYPGQINPKDYMDALQVEQAEYDLIHSCERGHNLYRCGNERYLLQVIAPEHKVALFGNGELGHIKRVNWVVTDWYRTQFYYDSGAWRATWAGEGGGVLLNQCPHQLDLLQWLFGLPVRVHAFCHEGKWHDIEVEDDVTAYMEFEGGATGVFITSTGDAPGTNRLEVTGTKGKLICEDDKLTFQRLEQDERIWCVSQKTGFDKPPMECLTMETDGSNPQHTGVLNAFADHIVHGTPLIADGREGIRGLMLSNAIHLSGWTGETVELPIDEARFLSLLNQRRAHSRCKADTDVTMDAAGSFGSQVR